MKVYVLGKPYTVKRMAEVDANGMLGAACRSAQRINLNKEQADDQLRETLLHEVIHIVNDELLIGLSEEDVSRLSVGLYSAGCRVDEEDDDDYAAL